MTVYPVPGRKVRDPVTKRVLTDEGLEVSIHDIFWAKRVRDGDVTTTAPAAPTTAAAEEKAEAKPAAPVVVQPVDHSEQDEES